MNAQEIIQLYRQCGKENQGQVTLRENFATAVPSSVVKPGKCFIRRLEGRRSASWRFGRNQDSVVEQDACNSAVPFARQTCYQCLVSEPGAIDPDQVEIAIMLLSWWELLSISVLKSVLEPWLTWVPSLRSCYRWENSHVGCRCSFGGVIEPARPNQSACRRQCSYRCQCSGYQEFKLVVVQLLQQEFYCYPRCSRKTW